MCYFAEENERSKTNPLTQHSTDQNYPLNSSGTGRNLAYRDFFSSCRRPRSMYYYPCMDSRLSPQKGILFKVSFTSQSPKETCAESLGAINVRILIYRPWPISETFGSTVRFWSLINIFFRFCWKSPGSLGIIFVAFSITYQADALCTGAFTHDEQ